MTPLFERLRNKSKANQVVGHKTFKTQTIVCSKDFRSSAVTRLIKRPNVGFPVSALKHVFRSIYKLRGKNKLLKLKKKKHSLLVKKMYK